MQILSAFRNTLMSLSVCEPGGGGGHSTKFYTGRLLPEVQPVRNPFYSLFDRLLAMVPLSMISTFYRQIEPLS